MTQTPEAFDRRPLFFAECFESLAESFERDRNGGFVPVGIDGRHHADIMKKTATPRATILLFDFMMLAALSIPIPAHSGWLSGRCEALSRHHTQAQEGNLLSLT